MPIQPYPIDPIHATEWLRRLVDADPQRQPMLDRAIELQTDPSAYRHWLEEQAAGRIAQEGAVTRQELARLKAAQRQRDRRQSLAPDDRPTHIEVTASVKARWDAYMQRQQAANASEGLGRLLDFAEQMQELQEREPPAEPPVEAESATGIPSPTGDAAADYRTAIEYLLAAVKAGETQAAVVARLTAAGYTTATGTRLNAANMITRAKRLGLV